MNGLPREPVRLRELPARDDPADLGRLVRNAIRAPAEPVPRLKGRIRHTLRRRSVGRRRYLRVALVGGVIFLTGGVVGAVVQPILHLWPQAKVESVANIYPSPPPARTQHRRLASALSDVADQASPLPAGPVAPPSPTPGPAPVPSAAPVAAPATLGPARAEPASTRTTPAPLRAALRPTASPAASSTAGRAGRPDVPRHPEDSHPLRTATLEPPSERSARWLAPPASPPGGAARSDHGVTAPQPSSPSPAPPEAESRLPPAVGGGTGLRPIATPPGPAGVAPKPALPPPPSEQALLSRAVRSLRSEHRPESALAVLDEYVAQFPSGSLLPEATRLRTEALLALGQKQAALAELNRPAAPGAAGGEAGRLVRAELHAAAGRWQEALVDFNGVVRARLAHELGAETSSTKARERLERALWGRAAARSHLGDETGARADLRECLRRFPQGRFAAQAARLLGELR
jgi:TolA-binding protein